VDLVIDVNGVPWVRVYTNASGVWVRHADGSQLLPAEGQAFRDLYALPAVIEFAILSLFQPVPESDGRLKMARWYCHPRRTLVRRGFRRNKGSLKMLYRVLADGVGPGALRRALRFVRVWAGCSSSRLALAGIALLTSRARCVGIAIEYGGWIWSAHPRLENLDAAS